MHWCQLSGKDGLSVSDYKDIDFPLMTANQNVSSLLPISRFPHFPFLISHFLVPTFRVTHVHWGIGLNFLPIFPFVPAVLAAVFLRGFPYTPSANNQALKFRTSNLS